MKTEIPTRVRKLAAACSAAVCVVAVVALAIDYSVQVKTADELRQRRDDAEVAARENSAAAAALQAEVERQTAQSLARTQRQRTIGIISLVSAGCCIALLKWRKSPKPAMPAAIAHHCGEIRSRIVGDQSMVPAEIPEADLPPVDLTIVDEVVRRVGAQSHRLIPLLHELNIRYHFLPPAALDRLVETTEVTRDQAAGVVSFYSSFRTRPRGKHLVQVCRGTACHIAGADHLLDELHNLLGIPAGRDTDAGGIATLETVGCLGCCTLAPVLKIDDRTEGHTQIDELRPLVDWERANSNGMASQIASPITASVSPSERLKPKLEIRVGLGSCCVAGGSRRVMETLQQELALQRRDAVIKPVGCVGICHLTPLVEVVVPDREPIVATRATPADVRRILRALPGGSTWQQRLRGYARDLWQRNPEHGVCNGSGCELSAAGDPRLRNFIDPQVRIVTEHSGEMNPMSLEDYARHDGFVALEKSLHQFEPSAVIDTVAKSGLRGRGGGGFPTAKKWALVGKQNGPKYLVCNGDEGDPGAFMDRMVMESYPFRVIEGMLIAAYAVGADRAIIYVRHEYPLAVERLRNAIDCMKRVGYLGENILDTQFSLDVEIVEGAGAFICGEETALLQSIMGRRGTPQHRPPYPIEHGLWGQPTLVNNVETLACVPWILRNGPEKFAALGTTHSTGTKVFSLAGKVRRGGLIEIPIGLSIRQVVEGIGGGVKDGRRFKAVQIGGPSGGCVPAELGDTPIDFEALKEVGAIMGSGGLVVMDDTDCMVDVARYFLEFTQKESCGHCTFCRIGTRKLLDIFERLCAGKGHPRDLEQIETLSQSIIAGSLCGLGKTAPNPVLTTLRYFRDEYEAHLHGRCPAGRCKNLIRYEVTRDCVGCTLCAQHCPAGAIPPTPYRQHVIDDILCTRCDVCRTQCPEQAIRIL